jgi:hypothetical protein
MSKVRHNKLRGLRLLYRKGRITYAQFAVAIR